MNKVEGCHNCWHNCSCKEGLCGEYQELPVLDIEAIRIRAEKIWDKGGAIPSCGASDALLYNTAGENEAIDTVYI